MAFPKETSQLQEDNQETGTSSPTREEIIASGGDLLAKMGPSEAEIPESASPEYRQTILDVRKLIGTALVDEDLLRRFTRKGSDYEIQVEKLPPLLQNVAQKAGVRVESEEQLEELCDAFRYSNYRNIQLYLKKPPKENLYRAICEYADLYFQTKYGIETAGQAKAVFRRLAPSLYKDLPVEVNFAHVSGVEAESADAIIGSGTCKITYWVAEPLTDQRDYQNLETKGVFRDNDYRFRRKTNDLLRAIHEYAHGIYDGIVQPKPKSSEEYQESADRSLTEGFAVLIELLACDMLTADAAKIGLDERDIRDLQEWKAQRIRSLRRHFSRARSDDAEEKKQGEAGLPYTEGTVKIMHKLYKRGGMEEVERFLRAIDPEKTVTLKRWSSKYMEALKDPKGFKVFLKEG